MTRVSLDAVRAATNNVRRDAVAIIEACGLAGRPGLAAELIAEGLDAAGARRRLESLSAPPVELPSDNASGRDLVQQPAVFDPEWVLQECRKPPEVRHAVPAWMTRAPTVKPPGRDTFDLHMIERELGRTK